MQLRRAFGDIRFLITVLILNFGVVPVVVLVRVIPRLVCWG